MLAWDVRHPRGVLGMGGESVLLPTSIVTCLHLYVLHDALGVERMADRQPLRQSLTRLVLPASR